MSSDAAVLGALAQAIHPVTPQPATIAADPEVAVRALALARRYRVSAVLVRALDRTGMLRTLAAPTRATLQRNVLDAELLRSRLEVAALDICKLLERSDIPYIFLKGAALGRTVYGDPSLRPIGDVDILVHERHFDNALQSLANAGWKLPTQRALVYWRKARFNVGIITAHEPRTLVELHWSIAQRGRHFPDIDEIFRRSSAFDFHGRSVRALSAADQLLHLALHYAYHYFEPNLIWLYDLALLHMSHPPLDEVMNRARQWGATIPLALSTLAVDKAFPGVVLERLHREAQRNVRAAGIAQHLGSPEPVRLLASTDSRGRQLLLALLTLDSGRQVASSLTGWALRALRYGDRAGLRGELLKHERPS